MNQENNQELYYEFMENVSKGVLEKLGGEYQTRIITNTRNNGVQRHGIAIRRQEEMIAPTIYLEDFYKEFNDALPMEKIVAEVLEIYFENSVPEEKTDIGQIVFGPEQIKKNLIFRIVNYPKNAKILQDMPHIPFLNLAVVFQVLVYQKEDGIGTVTFTGQYHELCKRENGGKALFGTLEELFLCARENTARLFPERLYDMEEIMNGLLHGKKASPLCLEERATQKEEMELFVLTNETGISGAGCLLYPHMIKRLKEYLGGDFYILPSSIHEVILLPIRKAVCEEELNDMIKEINLTQVPEEEILSDHAYHSQYFLEVIEALSRDGHRI